MSHWYSWFPGDYMRDTQHLSMVEDAAYRRLLDAYYMTGKLSANAEVLLRICRAISPDEQAAVRKVAAEFFDERDGYLYSEKVEREIAYSRAVSEKRSDAGRKGAAVANGKRKANAGASASANVASSAAANAAASASAIPHPQVNLPPTAGAVAPQVSDPIFGHGLQMLVSKGIKEKAARSFLGLMRKDHGDALVVEAIAKADADDVTDPVPWLRQYLSGTQSRGARRAPIPENFDSRNYGQGGRL